MQHGICVEDVTEVDVGVGAVVIWSLAVMDNSDSTFFLSDGSPEIDSVKSFLS